VSIIAVFNKKYWEAAMGVWRKVLQAILTEDGSPSMYVGLIETRTQTDRPYPYHPSDAPRPVDRRGPGGRK